MANNELSIMLTAKGNLESELKNARTRVKELGDEIKQAQASGSGVGEDLAAEYRKASIAAKNLSEDLNKVNKDVKKTATESTSAAAKVGRAWQKAASVFNNDLVAGLSAAALIAFGKKAVTTFSSVQDASSALSATFGANGDALIKWAKQSGDALNMSQTEALNAAQNFAIFADTAGLSGKSLETFTTDLTARAADLASFYGGSTADAVERLTSGLAGQSEVLRKYGIIVDDNTLKAKAQEMQIYSGNGVLDQRSKILAIQALIMQDSARAAGDVARTSDSMANQIKDSEQQMSDFNATVGETLAVALNPLMKMLNGAMGFFSALPNPIKQVSIAIGFVSAAALIVTPRIVAMMASMRMAGVTAGGMVTKVKGAASALMGPWGIAIAAGAAAISYFGQQAAASSQRVDDFAASIDAATGVMSGAGISSLIDQLTADISPEDWKNLEKYGITLGDTAKAIMGGSKSWDVYRVQVNGVALSLKAMDDGAADAAKALWGNGNSLADNMDTAQIKAKLLAEAMDTTGKSAGASANGIDDAGKSALTASQRVQALVDAVTALGKSVSLAQSVRSFRKTVKDYIKKPSTDAALSMVSDFDSAFANFEEGSAAQAKFAQANYARMAAAIKASGIDKEIKTGILDNLAATKTKADEVLAGLKTLDGQKVGVDVSIIPRGALPSTETPITRAMGGAVWGAGTATSDSIPALLSNGEYVIRASAAKSIGYDRLNKLNHADKMSSPSLLQHLTLQGQAEAVAASGPLIGQIVVNNPATGVEVEKAVTRGMARAQRIQRERAVANG